MPHLRMRHIASALVPNLVQRSLTHIAQVLAPPREKSNFFEFSPHPTFCPRLSVFPQYPMDEDNIASTVLGSASMFTWSEIRQTAESTVYCSHIRGRETTLTSQQSGSKGCHPCLEPEFTHRQQVEVASRLQAQCPVYA